MAGRRLVALLLVGCCCAAASAHRHGSHTLSSSSGGGGGGSSSHPLSSSGGDIAPTGSRHRRLLGLPRLPRLEVLQNSTKLYEKLEPLANVIDIKGAWRAAGLPPPPPVLCHVGLLGWHCHNTTLNPWNPKSILPKEATPAMPENATCIICPAGWRGGRGSVAESLFDLPLYVRSRGEALPAGMWDGTKLLAAGGGGGGGEVAAAAAASGSE